MTFTKEQERAAYKKVPPEIQNFFMDEETSEASEAAIAAMGLDEDMAQVADSELNYAVLGMQTFEAAIKQIASASGKPIEEVARAADGLEKATIAKYTELGLNIDDFVASNQSSDKGLLNIPPEIMAKQIKLPSEPLDKPLTTPDDLPEIVPGQTAHDVPHVEIPASAPVEPLVAVKLPAMPTSNVAVKTAPASEAPIAPPIPEAMPAPKSIVEEKLSQVVSAPAQTPTAPVSTAKAYEPGKDPYREPIE